MSDYDDPARQQRRGLVVLAVTVFMVTGLAIWGLTSDTEDPWLDVCKPAIDAKLKSGGQTDYRLDNLLVQVAGDRSVEASGLVESAGVQYAFRCNLDSDLDIKELSVEQG